MLYTDQRQNPAEPECDHGEFTIFDGHVWCVRCGECCGYTSIRLPYYGHLCAWCHSAVDSNNNAYYQFSPEQYAIISANPNQSHGICNACKAKQIPDKKS